MSEEDDFPTNYAAFYNAIPSSIPRRGRTGRVREAPKIRNAPIKQPLYSDKDVKRLSDLVIMSKKGIKYNPRLTDIEGAKNYITKRNLEGWEAVAKDYDDDPSTPDNVILFDKYNAPRVIDGYSFSKRRPDFLFQKPAYKAAINEARGRLNEGFITEDVFKITQSDLKQYYKTHSTEQSRNEEGLEDWKNRRNKEKSERIVHKMYLEATPKEQRSVEKEAAFIEQYKDVKESPSITLRKLIADRVKNFEINGGFRYIEKFRLLTELYKSVINSYRQANNIDPAARITGHQYSQIFNVLFGADMKTLCADLLDKWPAKIL
jgi:uncharacterized protein YdaT